MCNSFVLAVVILASFYSLVSFLNFVLYYSGDVGLFKSQFGSQRTAPILIFSAALGIALLKEKINFLTVFNAIVPTIGVILSGSRGALISLFCVFLLSFVRLSRNWGVTWQQLSLVLVSMCLGSSFSIFSINT